MIAEQDSKSNPIPMPRDIVAAQPRRSVGLNLLIVEDDEDQLAVMKILFERAGWSVCGFLNGQEAIQKSLALPFDAAVVDMMLPGSSGFQVVQAIRAKHGPTIPIVMVSGEVQSAHRDYADILGISMFLPKPFEPTLLLQHVQELCVPPKPMSV